MFLGRLFENVRRQILGHDIFVSYSRLDGWKYAIGLEEVLSRKGYACYVDAFESEPGPKLPEPLKSKLRRSFLLVIVGSPGAASSELVKEEIAEFSKTR